MQTLSTGPGSATSPMSGLEKGDSTSPSSSISSLARSSVTRQRITPEEQQAPSRQAAAELHFSVNTGLEHQLKSDLDGAGELDVTRFRYGLGVRFTPRADFDVAIQFNYAFDNYAFSGSTSLGGPEPWDDVHTIGLNATVSYKATNEWTVFGGPVFQFSHESDGDIGDGFTGGGFIICRV